MLTAQTMSEIFEHLCNMILCPIIVFSSSPAAGQDDANKLAFQSLINEDVHCL